MIELSKTGLVCNRIGSEKFFSVSYFLSALYKQTFSQQCQLSFCGRLLGGLLQAKLQTRSEKYHGEDESQEKAVGGS